MDIKFNTGKVNLGKTFITCLLQFSQKNIFESG